MKEFLEDILARCEQLRRDLEVFTQDNPLGAIEQINDIQRKIDDKIDEDEYESHDDWGEGNGFKPGE